VKSNRDPVIISMARSPIGGFGGSLKSVRAYELAAQIMKATLERADIEPGDLEDIMLGDCIQAPDEANTARTAALKCGIPAQVPAVTVQSQCASGMQTLLFASTAIRAGNADMILAGGVESMSNAPYFSNDTRWGARLRHVVYRDAMWELLYSGSTLLDAPGYIMGETAENIARKFNITREAQDAVALRSNNNAEAAIKEGKFKDEIAPIEIPQRKRDPLVFDTDEHPKLGLTIDKLAKLEPVFDKNGSVTAGNSSGINDGAAICVIASREKADALGKKPLAKIVDYATAGCDPALMAMGPIYSTEKLFKKSGATLNDIELIELNEAFASQYIACEQEMDIDREITNVNGSGIGLGHPVGCTGARIVISLINEMKRRSNTLGLATLCVGGGQGISMLIENE